MNADAGLEREVSSALFEAAPSREPDHLFETIVSTTGRLRPRPRWLAFLKEPPMRYRSHLATGSPTFRLAMVLSLMTALTVVLAGVAIAGASLLPRPALVAPSRNGLIAYDSNGQIWVMDPDATNPRALITFQFAKYTSPAWSPDGSRISFWAAGKGVSAEVADADGTNLLDASQDVSVTGHEPVEQIVWSPDSMHVAFVGSFRGPDSQLFVASADGTGAHQQLTQATLHPSFPAWSPDGTKIAFRGYHTPDATGTTFGVYVIDSRGGNATLVAPTGLDSRRWSAPSWSPDSQHIVIDVAHTEPDGQRDIVVAKADGTGSTTIASDPLDECCASWSGDGAPIAFLRGSYPNIGATGAYEYDLLTIDPDGHAETKVTAPKLAPGVPIWSPDGTRIEALGIYDFDPTKAYPQVVLHLSGGSPPVSVPAPYNVGASSWAVAR